MPATPTPFLPRGFAGLEGTTRISVTQEAGPQAPTPVREASPGSGLSVIEAGRAINGIRRAAGLPEMTLRRDLGLLAQGRAEALVISGTLTHAGGDPGSTPGERAMVAAGYHGVLVEHVMAVSAHQADPLAIALQVVLADEAHRANLLDPRLRHLGLGGASDGEWWYFVHLLAEHAPGGDPEESR